MVPMIFERTMHSGWLSNTWLVADKPGGHAVIIDTGGPIELSGTVVLTAPSNYDVNLRITARPTAPKQLNDSLQLLGPAERDGSRVFKLEGSI